MDNIVIKLENICFSYPGSDPVLEKLDFSLARGNKIGLIGSNGSGKTTLFHIIMGLIKPSEGKIEILGDPAENESDFRKIRHKVGFLFQNSDDQLFCPTVLEDVAFGPLNQGKSNTEAKKIAEDTLEYLGLSGFEDRITYKLSGGEKRLVSLATVLSMNPEVLLLDEPTAGLDDKTKSTLIQILADLSLSCIIISHEFDFLKETTDKSYMLKDRTIFLDDDLHMHQHVHAHLQGTAPHRHT
ncbi:MAG: ABC transporter ATP-binding protein [Desulfobacterales bacterium]|jgi:cobalt/nickel transport system ATP-binding protein|nr:ABC transporter ATP-binding protein [Desulfobacteraceae bacterium]MBT4364227.1 ABC transporter ATP-binding protein [Desulfobacteraceae bacterium]MBT7086433.1 ABC transporter ATP-binding protein [Desulfobacterales bacterium]MBT7698418.1 ABC transporter ATP-binding protein [Desulfobacterales bacterium]